MLNITNGTFDRVFGGNNLRVRLSTRMPKALPQMEPPTTRKRTSWALTSEVMSMAAVTTPK